MSIRTLNDIFFAAVERNLDRMMLSREAGKWLPISSRQFGQYVARTSRALHEWGIRQGDRVAILSENRPEWPAADISSLLLGAVTVPLYTTLTAEQTAFVLNDSCCRIIFLSSDQQLHKVLSILPQTQIEKIVVMDSIEFTGDLVPFADKCVTIQRITQQGPDDLGTEIEKQARAIGPDDLATIVYTSGTTGNSKGAMLTHGNIASNIQCSLLGFNMRPGLVSISFLPLCHITARHVDFSMLYHGVTLAYCPFIERLAEALLEVKPSLFVAVPRVYEKIYAQAERKAQGFPKRTIYDWALSVGREHKPEILAGKTPDSSSWKLANKLVFSKIREGMGGQVETFISGGAPLGRELAEWYATVGIRIHEGYGLTETSPVIAVNTPVNHRIGTVGKTLPNLEVRIAEDGEIIVRGPSVFKGYWNRPEETKAALEDGWFKTGDIGNIDADGYLSITDRKKDLIKTSGGKFIAPQPIENALKLNPYVGFAAILGDRRKFPAVMISPNFVRLEEWARENSIPFSSRAELVANPKVQNLYEGVVEEINQRLARFEKLKRVILVPDEFTADNGALTPTLKLRRRVIEDHYRKQIDELYAQAEAASVP
ncbi:MAG TPA: long-chain fatty acid--CoA ligase [Candidatus Dormibacteraeota bacterium]|nr:long-chain fatty acid--CoA ligase [Candidatus Dormibacteraeota bacterium]